MAKTDTINSKRNLLDLLKNKKTWKTIFISLTSALLVAFFIYIAPSSLTFVKNIFTINNLVNEVDSLKTKISGKATLDFVKTQVDFTLKHQEDINQTMWKVRDEDRQADKLEREMNKKEHLLILSALSKVLKATDKDRLFEEWLKRQGSEKMSKPFIIEDNLLQCDTLVKVDSNVVLLNSNLILNNN